MQIRVDGKTYQAHRLAWFYMTGAFPEKFIDHINGVRNDNAFANLRQVDNAGNMQNTRQAHRNNLTCGLLGVSKTRTGWRAMISVGGKNIYIGRYDTPENAHQAYLERKRVLHPTCTI